MEMDWKQRRQISRLSAILALLSAAVLIVLGIRYRASRPAEADAAGDQSGDPAVQTDLSALQYTNGSASLSFVMENGTWIWADDPDFPLNPENITAILDLVENLQYQQTLKPEEEQSAYGLDTPKAVVTVTDAGGAVRKLTLGKTTDDGTSYYMMEDDDFSTIYIIAGDLYGCLEMPVYDMMILPELPDLSEERLAQLTIRGPSPEAADGETAPSATVLILDGRWSVLSQTAVWSHGSDNVTSSPALQELVQDLAALSVIKCVDYHPSQQAASICGFDNPAAVLTVGYTTEGGAEETWTLTVGGAAAEGRYARLGDDTSIFLLPADSTDALLRLVSSGLDG